MAPRKKVQISQEAFDGAVRENMEEFDMDLTEAVEDAIKTFQLQGADLSGIVTSGDGVGNSDYVHPAVAALKELERTVALLRLENGKYIDIEAKLSDPVKACELFEDAVDALEIFADLCCKREPENAQIAVKNGGVEACISAHQALKTYRLSWASLSLKVLLSFLSGGRHSSVVHLLLPRLKQIRGCPADDQAKERFEKANGPQVVLEAVAIENGDLFEPMAREVSCIGASVLALAATKSETLKEKFMDLGAAQKLTRYLKNHAEEVVSDGAALQAACDAVRSLIVADDDRPAASKAFGNAMKIAKAGAVDAILEILPQKGKATPILSPLCLTLKCLAVNDEICKGVAEEGGLEMVLQFLDHSTKFCDKVVARSAVALLSQLAGSDANKDAVVSSGGLNQIIRLMSAYPEEPSVLQEGFAAIATLTLRSPQNATKAVEAGAVDMAAEMMERHSGAASMLRQACQMIRNLAVRNPENRPIILEKKLEPLIRKAKDTHEICKDVGSAALRDLALDNYQ